MPKKSGKLAVASSRPPKVSVLVLADCTGVVPVGTADILRKCGALHQQLTGAFQPFFEVELLSLGALDVVTPGNITIRCHRSIHRVRKTDLLVIPAIELDVEQKLEANEALVPHITRLHRAGAAVASVCTGAFLFAKTGLLDGQEATTHWAAAAKFRQMFPAVQLTEQRIVVDNGQLYTSAGATSFMNLVLYLVEKFCGRDTAIAASKWFLIDYAKPEQNAYAITSIRLAHDDEQIRQVQALIDRELHSEVAVTELAKTASMSVRTFVRRFKAALGTPPIRYIQQERVERAKSLLTSTSTSVEQIALQVGYLDVGSFRRLFQRQVGVAPKAYRDRYRRSLVAYSAAAKV